MPPLTWRRPAETIRKLGDNSRLALLALALGGGGCATQGPNHVYLTTQSSAAIQDLGPSSAVVADVIPTGESALGLAYDFNTDHLFVRLEGSIRVIERPSGKILREMPLPDDLRGKGPADLAIRSGDRHLFAAHPDGLSVVELTLFGETVRRIKLSGVTGDIRGLAYDQRGDCLLVLGAADGQTHVGRVAPDGNVTYYVTLAGAVSAVSLGYDSDAQRFFVPLADGHTLGEFDAKGALVRTHALTGGAITAIDAGPRSFVRVF
jgi:uncharacterized protein YjiK